MNLIDNKNSFKNNLIEINTEIKRRLNRKNSIMKNCIEYKLQNTLEMYENDLMDTCNYILTRNPLVISRGLNTLEKESKEEEKND